MPTALPGDRVNMLPAVALGCILDSRFSPRAGDDNVESPADVGEPSASSRTPLTGRVLVRGNTGLVTTAPASYASGKLPSARAVALLALGDARGEAKDMGDRVEARRMGGARDLPADDSRDGDRIRSVSTGSASSMQLLSRRMGETRPALTAVSGAMVMDSIRLLAGVLLCPVSVPLFKLLLLLWRPVPRWNSNSCRGVVRES